MLRPRAELVRRKGLEPLQELPHQNLNLARLPIPPPSRGGWSVTPRPASVKRLLPLTFTRPPPTAVHTSFGRLADLPRSHGRCGAHRPGANVVLCPSNAIAPTGSRAGGIDDGAMAGSGWTCRAGCDGGRLRLAAG